MADRLAGDASIVKLTYLVSHPIQYQAPLLQRIARDEDIRLKVIFVNKSAKGPQYDPGFGTSIQWDVPLREGFDNVDLADTGLAGEIRAADIIWLHGWQTRTLRRALGQAHQSGTPVLMRGENCDIAMPDGTGLRRIAKRAYLNRILGRCSAFLTIGSANAKYYLDRGVGEEKLFLTPYAVDNDRFAAQAAAAASSRGECKHRMGLGRDQPVVLYVGKFERRKRADLLTEAFKNARLQDLHPALVLVGEGEMEARLRRLAPEAVFAGFHNQTTLPALYDMADVVVLPSECEPWGLVVNEAMACGTAVVTSDQVGCAADLVTPDCGVVFPSGDADALAAALVHSLKNAPAMGRAAAESIRKWNFEEDLRGLKQAIDYVM